MDLAAAVDNSEREEPVRQRVPLGMIALDEVLQPRARIDHATIEHYAELLADGVKLPPVELVFDGQTTWLANGYHRYFGHQKAGLEDIEAVVRFGGKNEALRLSLGANADHGQPRTNRDLGRAYDLAVLHRLVDPTSVEQVMEVLRVHATKAKELTKRAREQRDAERLHRIVELRSKGWSWARIGKVVGLSSRAVGNIIASLPADPNEEVVKFGRDGETSQAEAGPAAEAAPAAAPAPDEAPVPEAELDLTAGEPDVLEEAAVGGPAEGTPLEDYIKQQNETEAQRRMWFETLEALERFAKLPSPAQLFENRDQSFDHLIGQALDVADAWIVAMGEKWDAEKAH
jgi:ParB-like chromosome segregation protein Spo0J